VGPISTTAWSQSKIDSAARIAGREQAAKTEKATLGLAPGHEIRLRVEGGHPLAGLVEAWHLVTGR